MPNIQLRTGNTIYVSTYEYYFKLEEKDMDIFYQSCEADNLGIYIDNPFSNAHFDGAIDEETEIPDNTAIENPNWDISI